MPEKGTANHMTDHAPGHVKRDPASGAVALRTNQPVSSSDPLIPSQAWLVTTIASGPRFSGPGLVADWDDLYIPEVGGG